MFNRERMSACRAFTFLEVMVVVVVIGILAALVVPQMTSASQHAKSAAVQSGVAAVRTGIAAFRTRAIISGDDPFPTLQQLTTAGTVLQDDVPVNPYNGLRTVQAVSAAAATARQVSNENAYGWNYFVNNDADPPTAVFYCNSDDATEVSDGGTGVKTANQL
ncbi:MAG: hypothetical protein AMXMBFR58_34750 [Phycisphaerae bacterium]|nr:type II secretion system GspH family protein [Phycisphaerales bacterium]